VPAIKLTDVPEPTTTKGERRKIVLSTYVGTTIEWFDFYLYGIAAALYFPQIFFTNNSQTVGIIASFGALAGGFLARPIGGIIGGHFGDRYGRKKVLVASMVIMGTSTTAVGLLPGHATIGIWAPMLLIIARLLQGLGAGAEWGGGVLMIVEHFSGRRRGFWGSLGNTGVYTGGALATMVFAFISRFPEDHQLYLWRIPFVASALLVFLGLWIRLGISESPAFVAAKEAEAKKAAKSAEPLPFMVLIRRYRRQLAIVVLLSAAANVGYQTYVTFGTSYTRTIDGNVSQLLALQTIIGLIALVLTPFFGWLSDVVGRKLVTGSGLIFMVPWVFLLFKYLNEGNMGMALAMLILCEIGHSAIYGPLSAFLSELFNTTTRYSGASMGYQVGGAIAGLAPLLAASILAASGGAPNVGWVPLIVVASSAAGLIALCYAPERSGQELDD
jgi:MFS transporter, MHS family, shikimate and dehydroshikimate transport protein